MKKSEKANTIEEQLKSIPRPEPEQTQEEFWDEFSARAASLEQDPVTNKTALIVFSPLTLKIAASFFIVLAALFVVWNSVQPTNQHHSGNVSVIEEYEIFTPNNGVMILSDEQNSGTILWVSESSSAKPQKTPADDNAA